MLGPLHWNIIYDEMLRLHLAAGVQINGFADYIAIVAVTKHIRQLEEAANRAIH